MFILTDLLSKLFENSMAILLGHFFEVVLWEVLMSSQCFIWSK